MMYRYFGTIMMTISCVSFIVLQFALFTLSKSLSSGELSLLIGFAIFMAPWILVMGLKESDIYILRERRQENFDEYLNLLDKVQENESNQN